ncbi:hypothetical protein PIB30_007858 [Stylosanthes scabra]|uniref:Uncharacterized protein n=1 Tax=Stylosanthes scabra TaxID=79078 RepID=A0ABU6R4G3_9FABA|nr:hypothetical protein [Stylosanthes scabra]
MSDTLVRVERKSKRRNDSVPALVPLLRSHDSDSDDHQMVAHALLSRKRKNVEGHGSRSKRTRNPIDFPTHSKGMVAENGNLFFYGNEELHQQPHNQSPEEEETQPQPQPSPEQPQQPPQEEVPQKQPQQQQQDEFIDISSSSGREPEPTPIRVLVPKVEADLVSSPRDRPLTDTLLRMRNDEQAH